MDQKSVPGLWGKILVETHLNVASDWPFIACVGYTLHIFPQHGTRVARHSYVPTRSTLDRETLWGHISLSLERERTENIKTSAIRGRQRDKHPRRRVLLIMNHLFIVNQSGGLIHHRPISTRAPRIGTNDWLRIGSTFHSLHAIAAEASPVKLPGNKNSS